MSRAPGEHRDPLAARAVALPPEQRPPAGPIAVLPTAPVVFTDAVRAGGGDVQELSAATRGIVWLSDRRADELVEILDAHPDIGWVQLPGRVSTRLRACSPDLPGVTAHCGRAPRDPTRSR